MTLYEILIKSITSEVTLLTGTVTEEQLSQIKEDIDKNKYKIEVIDIKQ